MKMACRSVAVVLLVTILTSSTSWSALTDGGTAKAGRRWGVNVHWEQCELHQPCPPTDLGASGGPRPGEAAQLGQAFGRARTGVRWFLVEQQLGIYNFSAYERMLTDLAAAGVGAYWILAHGNPLYGSSESPGNPISAQQREGFARFAVAMMAHFRGHDVVWEVWNEPNDGASWHNSSGAHHANSSQYAALLNTVGAAVRGDPRTQGEYLVGPTTSGVDLQFIADVGETGALSWLDAVSVHPYRAGGPESVLADYAELRALLRTIPDAPSTILSGEWGWASCRYRNGTASACHSGGGGVGQVVTEHEQASLLARQWLVNDAANVSLSIWYDWINDGSNPQDAESNFGAMYPGYHNESHPRAEKLNYKAARTLQRVLGSLEPLGAVCNATLGEYAVRYGNANAKGVASTWAVWQATRATLNAKCDHRQWMCCRYANGTIIPHCATQDGCEERGCCWDPNPHIPGMWCSHPNPPPPPPLPANVCRLPVRLSGCFDVYDLLGGSPTAKICSDGSGFGVRVVQGKFALKIDPQYLVPTATEEYSWDWRNDGAVYGFCMSTLE
eukprot:COSAG02_NODE_7_length_64539_cov_120.393482_43_plen_558_part_00